MTHATTPMATITTEEAAARSFDVLIIGAGIAGAATALAASQRGLRVLLVDKARFPRPKLCGSCFNHTVVALLQSLNAQDIPASSSAAPLHHMLLAAGRHHARFALPPSFALSRSTFDAALIARAIDHGAHFLDQSAVHIHQGIASIGHHTLRTSVIVVSDGLKGTALDDSHAPRIAPRARLGIGSIFDAPASMYPPGIIHMACASDGYVGLVRLEDHRLNLAAAIDPGAIAHHGSIPAALEAIITQAHLPLPCLPDRPNQYMAVGALTRARTRCWSPGQRGMSGKSGILIVGDAAGYVEPFTGEGMAWALTGGIEIVPFLQRAAAQGWHDDLGRQWQSHITSRLLPRHRLCRAAAWALRHPMLTRFVTRCIARCPAPAEYVSRFIHRPWHTEGLPT